MSISFPLTRWLSRNENLQGHSAEVASSPRRRLDFDDVGNYLEEDMNEFATDLSATIQSSRTSEKGSSPDKNSKEWY